MGVLSDLLSHGVIHSLAMGFLSHSLIGRLISVDRLQ